MRTKYTVAMEKFLDPVSSKASAKTGKTGDSRQETTKNPSPALQKIIHAEELSFGGQGSALIALSRRQSNERYPICDHDGKRSIRKLGR